MTALVISIVLIFPIHSTPKLLGHFYFFEFEFRSQGYSPQDQRFWFYCNTIPDSKVHGAHLGPVGPRWAPWWPHEPCYQGYYAPDIFYQTDAVIIGIGSVCLVLVARCFSTKPSAPTMLTPHYTSKHFQLHTLRPRQNGRHFTGDIFLNENMWISINDSPKFVPKGLINNIPALVQIMAWRRPSDKPLSEPMVLSLLTHICVTWPQWVNELTR